MNYKRKKNEKNNEEFFVYQPKYTANKKNTTKISKNNPFGKLSELRFR